MIDAIACEPHFIDHAAPVWLALPAAMRGAFITDKRLEARARSWGIEPQLIDIEVLRRTPQQGPVHDGTPALVVSIGDIKIGRRIGRGPFVFMEHGAGQAYGPGGAAPSYSGGPGREDNALFLVPNEYSARLWRGAYPAARVEIVGSPRLDDLPARTPGPGPVVAISFHGDWPSGVPYGGTALYDYSPVLAALAKQYTVIGHGHPGKGWGEKLARMYQRAGIEYVPEFDDVCRRADLYVCDNSSTIYEFASTGRPVVLLNAAHWHKRGGPGGRFWDWAGIGVNVDRPDGLAYGIERALADPETQRVARNNALALVYAYRSGAAERAAAVIAEWRTTAVAAA